MKTVILATLLASAAVQAGTATISWVPPTQHTDGSPITGNLTYDLYRALFGQVRTLYVSGLTVPPYVDTVSIGNWCYDLVANEAGNSQPSDHSTPGCKNITQPKPAVITVASNAFEQKNLLVVQVGKVNLGVTCGVDAMLKSPFTGAELFNIPRWTVKFSPHKDNGSQTFGVCA